MLPFFFIDRKVKQKIEEAEKQTKDSGEAYNGAKKKHSAANEAYHSKQREWRSTVGKKKRFEEDINLLEKEIQKLERQGERLLNFLLEIFSITGNIM